MNTCMHECLHMIHLPTCRLCLDWVSVNKMIPATSLFGHCRHFEIMFIWADCILWINQTCCRSYFHLIDQSRCVTWIIQVKRVLLSSYLRIFQWCPFTLTYMMELSCCGGGRRIYWALVLMSLLFQLLEACVKNCGKRFHVQIASQEFLEDFLKTLKAKYNPSRELQMTVLGLLQVHKNPLVNWIAVL